MACRGLAFIEERQEVEIGKESQAIVFPSTQRGVKFEAVDVVIVVGLDLDVIELDLVPGVDADASGHTDGEEELAGRSHFDHQGSLKVEHTQLAFLDVAFHRFVDEVADQLVVAFLKSHGAVEAVVVPSQSDTGIDACTM